MGKNTEGTRVGDTVSAAITDYAEDRDIDRSEAQRRALERGLAEVGYLSNGNGRTFLGKVLWESGKAMGVVSVIWAAMALYHTQTVWMVYGAFMAIIGLYALLLSNSEPKISEWLQHRTRVWGETV